MFEQTARNASYHIFRKYIHLLKELFDYLLLNGPKVDDSKMEHKRLCRLLTNFKKTSNVF
ncbi:hypothetical protein BSM4216_1747 [Bacillus smithii]|nr:hypothetical protein BSM4216_1747 [Bacillus smithii]